MPVVAPEEGGLHELQAVLEVLAGALPGSGLTVAGADAVYLAPGALTATLAQHDVLTGVTSPGPALLDFAILVTLAARGTDLYAVSGALPVDGMIDLLRIDPASGAIEVAATLPATVRAIARDA